MLFCLASPLTAMTSLLTGQQRSKQQTSTVNQTTIQNVSQPATAPPTTFTSPTISSNNKNRTNRAVITTSPKRFEKPTLSSSNKLNQSFNESNHATQSLPYNLNENHQKVNLLARSNESGPFQTTNRSSNSLPSLSNNHHKQVANSTTHHQTRIVIARNQSPKIEAPAHHQFTQLDASTILHDLNAQASSSTNLVKNSQSIDTNNKDDGKADSKQDNKMESSKRSAQIEPNLPETFYQQTKKRMIATSSSMINGLALAQTRNPVLSSILKDVRPPSVSYSNSVSVSSNAPKSTSNKKPQFTRITPNSAQISSYSLPAPQSTFSTNTSPTPIKRPLGSSTNKDTIITKDAITAKDAIITKDSIMKERTGSTPATTDSVFVVHHHHLVSGQTSSANEQSANKYTLLSSTPEPPSKSKNYYKNEEEDDRATVSTASIFFDDEPANNLDKTNSLDLSMLLKKEFDEQSNNKIIPRDQLVNGQYGANLNLFALLPTATTVTITPISSPTSTVASHDRSFNNMKDPSVFSTTVRSIKVDLNRNPPLQNANRTKAASIEKLHSVKLFGQRESSQSLNDIWRATNGHSRVPSQQANNNNNLKDAYNLTNHVVDMKQFQLNLAKTAVRENPKERVKSITIIDNSSASRDKNTISTFNIATSTQPTLTSTVKFNNNNNNNHKNKQLEKNSVFKYVGKSPLDDTKLMDNVLNSLDTSNLPNGLDALDSNQIYNRTMLINDLKEYKELKDRHLKKSTINDTATTTTNDQDVLIRPVNDEDELLNNALGSASADSPSSRESYRLTTERLAYILIGSCCAISIFCLIVVAFSIRCRDMCDEYKQWKNAEKLALFNYRYQQHQQQQQRNHRLKLHQMAAFGNLVSESNSSSSQLISGSSNAAVNQAVGALTNLSRPIFGPSCCCCPAGTNVNNNDNNNKKHNNNNNKISSNDQSNFHFHPCPRGRLPFGAASSVFARFNGANVNQLVNGAPAGATQLVNENNENSLDLLDEETLNGSLTDEFTTSKLRPAHASGRTNAAASANQPGVCLQCTCEDSFEDEESDLGSLPTAVKNASSGQQYLRPNQLINHTHAKHHHFSNPSTSNVNSHHHHHHINQLNQTNQNNANNKHKRGGVYQPMDSNWIQSSMIVDELHRKHNQRLINGNNQAKYDELLSLKAICALHSAPLICWNKSSSDRLI